MAEKKIITLNPLGEDCKTQWKNAIGWYRMVLNANLDDAFNLTENIENKLVNETLGYVYEYTDMSQEDFNDLSCDISASARHMSEDFGASLEILKHTMENVLSEMERLVDALFTEESEEDTEE